MSVTEVTFFQKKIGIKNPFYMEFFIEYKSNLNTIQFFSQTRNRSAEKYFEISERAGGSSAGSEFKE
jgi:hypothetical protein